MQLTLGVAASAASESSEGNNLGLVLDVVEEGKSALQLHAVDGLGGLAGVLEADTQVRAPGAGALSGRNFLSSVTDLYESEVHRQYYSLGKKEKGKLCDRHCDCQKSQQQSRPTHDELGASNSK